MQLNKLKNKKKMLYSHLIFIGIKSLSRLGRRMLVDIPSRRT